MIIKVCGMRDAENIQQVSQVEGIDWMGFIFTDKSKRYALANDDFDAKTNNKKVGVFVDAEIEEIIELIEKYNLDILQLHGFESPEYISDLKSRIAKAGGGSPSGLGESMAIMKAFRVDADFDFESTKEYESVADYFLFDAKGDAAGGNGIQFDWSVVDGYNGETSFLLAGGINPDSVEKIKSFHHPKWMGIDVNSGFESEPGMKRIKELKEFMRSLNLEKNITV